jgi:hypothetical protein
MRVCGGMRQRRCGDPIWCWANPVGYTILPPSTLLRARWSGCHAIPSVQRDAPFSFFEQENPAASSPTCRSATLPRHPGQTTPKPLKTQQKNNISFFLIL